MTLYQFNLLEDEEERLGAIMHNGECIASRAEDAEEIFLFQVGSFYVEVSSGDAKGNEILKFRSFSSIEQLNPYLGQINITSILTT